MSFGPASNYYNRPSQIVFSDIPSDRLRCPRLQLRGSAGFAPASHKPACRRPTIMREPNFEKEQKQQPGKSTGHADTKSNADGAALHLLALDYRELRRPHSCHVV